MGLNCKKFQPLNFKTLNNLEDFIQEDLIKFIRLTKSINITDALVVKSCFKLGFIVRLSAVSEIVSFLKTQ